MINMQIIHNEITHVSRCHHSPPVPCYSVQFLSHSLLRNPGKTESRIDGVKQKPNKVGRCDVIKQNEIVFLDTVALI